MSEKEIPPITFEIHVGKGGGVRVDPKEFLEDPEVKRKTEEMRKYDVLGRRAKSKESSVEKSD